jgi:hypothetical protein
MAIVLDGTSGITTPTIAATSASTFTGALALPSGGLNVGSGQLAVDASGRVTMSSQPAWAARFTSTKTQDINVPMVFDLVAFNIGSNYNNATGIFTAPVAGRYQINTGALRSTGGSSFMNLQVAINGVSITGLGTPYTANLTTEISFGASWVVNLAANDALAIWFGSNTPTNLYGQETFFSGHLIG